MEWTPASGEQERHNVAVITEGSRYYSLCSVSSSLSHETLEQPFRTLQIKWGVKYFGKEVLLRLPYCVFLRASDQFIASVCIQHIYVYFCMNQKMTIQHYHTGFNVLSSGYQNHSPIFLAPVMKLVAYSQVFSISSSPWLWHHVICILAVYPYYS